MNAVGIIAEYNPMHNGHKYHIEQARILSGCESVVVALSGNFVQRGEPAVLDKWTRTQMVLSNGADLVVEIPTSYCLGNAGQYAAGGVKTLESIGKVSHIAFGSESADVEGLSLSSEFLNQHEAEINSGVKQLLKTGLSYPAARAELLKELSFDEPNDVLAVEYIRHMELAKPVVIKRLGAGYNDMLQDTSGFQSASGIRKLLRTTEELDSIRNYVPADVYNTLAGSKLNYTDEWWNTLRFAVISASSEQIDNCPSGGEGLGNLLKKKVYYAESWEDFVQSVKSKRYTYTRVSRLCMQLILGIKREDAELKPGYIRVLGFNSKGRELLREVRKEETSKLPIITNINKEAGIIYENNSARRLLDVDIHASDVYNLVTGRDIAKLSDHRITPVIL